MTADECQRPADEVKMLVSERRDLWERETYLRIATPWQLLAGYKAEKGSRHHPLLCRISDGHLRLPKPHDACRARGG
jgi:hypothetical protein